MNSLSVKMNLTREKQQFQAAVAIVKGELSELLMLQKMLHPKEINICTAYKYDRRKASYLLGRLSAKAAILNLTGTQQPHSIWIDRGVFHFPVVKCAEIHNIQVSISHYENIGLSIAFPEEHPMGIDLEQVDDKKIEVVLSQITDKEKKLLQEVGKNDAVGYFSIFSIKESLSKVLKTGMMLDFKFLELKDIKMVGQVLEVTFCNFGQYKAYSYFKSDFVFSMALPKRTTVDFQEVDRILELMS